MSVKLPAQALDTAVGAIRNWQLMHSNAALPLKLLFVCRGGKKRSVGLVNLSLLRQPVSRKIAAYFLREEHMLILPSHPRGRLKGM